MKALLELQLTRLRHLIAVHTLNSDIYWQAEIAAVKEFLSTNGLDYEVKRLISKHETPWKQPRRNTGNPVCR